MQVIEAQANMAGSQSLRRRLQAFSIVTVFFVIKPSIISLKAE
jgi:hypothetical protein